MSDSALRHRPILGGVFGKGRYALASMPLISGGLHAVRYMVIEPVSGVVLSIADDRIAALADARKLLAADGAICTPAARHDSDEVQQSLWPPEMLAHLAVPKRRRPVSRRRRDIFAKCSGRCHYCAASLELDGSWHVEHMMPRALGGLDDINNLVAACQPCNLAKRDRTALEFVVSCGLNGKT